MNRRHFFLLSTLLACGPMALSAEVLSWNEAIKKAAANNADILSAEQNVRALEATQTGTLSAFYPEISASLGVNNSKSNVDAGTNESYSAQLALKQNLFSGFSDLNKYEQAKENTLIVKWKLQSAKAEVSSNLKQAYSGLDYATELVKLNKNIVQRRSENLRLVELRFEGGRENRGSVLLSQAYNEQAKYDVLEAEHLQNNQKSVLKNILGISPDTEVEIQDKVVAQKITSKEPSFIDLATQTPAYMQAAAQERVNRHAIDIARSEGFLPSLDLTGAVGKTDNSFFPESDSWNVGLTLSIPIFSGGRDYAALKTAQAQKLSSENQKLMAERTAINSLRQAYADYVVSDQKLRVDESFKLAAQARAKIARSKYNNGLMTFEEWDQIENDLITRERTFLSSQRQRVTAEAKWEQAQGIGVIP